MTQIVVLQLAVFLAIILALVKPLGWYMAQVYEGKPCALDPIMSPLQSVMARCCGISLDPEMDWKQYLSALLLFNMFGVLVVYLLQRLQIYLPFNPAAVAAVAPDLAFNTASSFVTNTDWQSYSGEASISYLTQTLALTVQNFMSAATGMSLVAAFIRGIVRHETNNLGNFWIDTIRGTLYILLPLSLILAVALASQGVIQNYKPYQQIKVLSPTATITSQTLAMGPVASQIAIKQLGSNGGGFFNTNSAHPFENPTPFTNFLELLAIILIPAALCYTFGVMIKDRRQGWVLLIAMVVIFVPCLCFTVIAESQSNPALDKIGIMHGRNMEGKEARFGVVSSALWATATTAVANGSVNSMHDSFMPLGSIMPLALMHMGEVVFGGVGCGLYGMLMLVIITVFVSGLMVGRTPEYLGKKIEPFEMKMAVLAVLIMPLLILLCTAAASVSKLGTSALGNPGAHGFTEILYGFTSMAANNGSAFGGLSTNTMFYNIVGALVMLISRYWSAIATMAIAGSLVRKKIIPVSAGTLATHTTLFMMLLIAVIIILAALSFLPALALGPIAEHVNLWEQYGH